MNIPTSLLFISMLCSANVYSVPMAYESACKYCHETGVGQSPKLQNLDDWAPRLVKGNTKLLQSVKGGMGGMPAGGLCAECSDEQLMEAISYMSSRTQASR
jgi:cytochrome c5